MVLVHSSPTTLEPYRRPNLGVLSSPRRFYPAVEIGGWSWAADNDAYSSWDAGRYRVMLEVLRGVDGCLFVTAPDVVGDGPETLRRFASWRDELHGFPVALVAQDGMRPAQLPWDAFSTLFLGGSTTWKMGADAAELALEARARGKWLHMGRVNGFRRLRYAKALGCDSVDGTCISRFRDSRSRLTRFVDFAAGPGQMFLEGWPA